MIFHGQNNDIATLESEESCESNFYNIKSYFCNVMTLKNQIRYKSKGYNINRYFGVENWFLTCVLFLR